MKTAFSKMLSRLRSETGRSQRCVAEDLGVSQALLSHYENGAREPKLEFIVKACDYYGVTADYILGRTPGTDHVPVPRGFEHAAQLIESLNEIFTILQECSDHDLSSLVLTGLELSVENVTALLRNPNAPYNPVRDANIKLAESALLDKLRKIDN